MHSLHIIHPAVLAAPHIGAFNLHPGPLLDAAAHGCVPARKQDLTRREFFGSKVPHCSLGYIDEHPFDVLTAKLTGERSAASPGTTRDVVDCHFLFANIMCSRRAKARDYIANEMTAHMSSTKFCFERK
jgi:hypothetical protein